ncbi:YqiA/YcfP family alpha/beta fold hydrolase [Colwelliaceae bacterium MEBiC 14330]
MMKKKLLYIHGFNSSPLSIKAEQTRHYLAKYFPQVDYFCPQLLTTPAQAISQLEQIICADENDSQWFLIGSSLGGYFASYLAAKYDCLAVLVNPAIAPYELLQDYIGEQKNPYTKEIYQVTAEHMQQLMSLECAAPTIDDKQKNNYLVMVQTGDEVLNYQQAVEKYQHCRLIVQEGGDHSFINFAQLLPTICDFFQLD